jgi:hypothetical protein
VDHARLGVDQEVGVELTVGHLECVIQK